MGKRKHLDDYKLVRDVSNEAKKSFIQNIRNKIEDKAFEYATGNLPVNIVRHRLYSNLFQGYDAGISNIYRNLKRVRSAVVDNVEEEGNLFKNHKARQRYMDDLFAEYLNIPKDNRRKFSGRNYLVDSKYSPTVGNDNKRYKALQYGYKSLSGSSGLAKEDEDRLVKAVMLGEYTSNIDKYSSNKRWQKTKANHASLRIGESSLSTVLNKYGLGTHTIGHGKDKEGEYVSYYDLWDMAPTTKEAGNKDESRGIGTPVNVYNRLYLDDYYGVPKQGAYYLPEIIVRPSLKSGGSIYIKPSHRGRLTELKARTGKTESELYNDGNPAHKKMVVFARNARKWNN